MPVDRAQATSAWLTAWLEATESNDKSLTCLALQMANRRMTFDRTGRAIMLSSTGCHSASNDSTEYIWTATLLSSLPVERRFVTQCSHREEILPNSIPAESSLAEQCTF